MVYKLILMCVKRMSVVLSQSLFSMTKAMGTKHDERAKQEGERTSLFELLLRNRLYLGPTYHHCVSF